MLSEEKLMVKLEEKAAMFNSAVKRGEFGAAHNIYIMAHCTAIMAEMSEQSLKKLFGDWDSDDGTETNTALDNGLFKRSVVNYVQWQCCIRSHQTFENMVMRTRKEEPLQFYGDTEYCARCQERKKRAIRHWDDSMLG